MPHQTAYKSLLPKHKTATASYYQLADRLGIANRNLKLLKKSLQINQWLLSELGGVILPKLKRYLLHITLNHIITACVFLSFFIVIAKRLTAAGVTPLMRLACPSVVGRIWLNFWTISLDKPDTLL